jgi:1-acyl-sn-glycerol-3-phosphate acyltransferase
VVRLAAWTDAPVYPVRIDGVRAEGKVFLAPLTPDRVTLTLYPALQVKDTASKSSLEQIRSAIETPADLSH